MRQVLVELSTAFYATICTPHGVRGAGGITLRYALRCSDCALSHGEEDGDACQVISPIRSAKLLRSKYAVRPLSCTSYTT